MGKRKRRGGQGFGRRQTPIGFKLDSDFNDLLSGKQVLVSGSVLNELKGIGDFFALFTFKEIAKKFPSFQQAIDTFSTSGIVYLARRRQLEDGKGLLTITPKKYRQMWREVYDSDGDFIFNWWTLPEINISEERSEISGGTRILARLAKPLVAHSEERFPIILHAVSFSEGDEVLDKNLDLDFAHLLFTASLNPKQLVQDRKIYFVERETISLTAFIPNAANAVVDIRKLRDYCLNPNHDDGKHKARLFSATLEMTANDAEELRQILLEIVKTHEAKPGRGRVPVLQDSG